MQTKRGYLAALSANDPVAMDVASLPAGPVALQAAQTQPVPVFVSDAGRPVIYGAA